MIAVFPLGFGLGAAASFVKGQFGRRWLSGTFGIAFGADFLGRPRLFTAIVVAHLAAREGLGTAAFRVKLGDDSEQFFGTGVALGANRIGLPRFFAARVVANLVFSSCLGTATIGREEFLRHNLGHLRRRNRGRVKPFVNLQCRECGLKGTNARIGHLGLPQEELLQILQPVQLGETRVRNLRPIEIQVFQMLEAGQMGQCAIGDFGALQVKAGQFRKARERCQAPVRHLRAGQIQPGQLGREGR